MSSKEWLAIKWFEADCQAQQTERDLRIPRELQEPSPKWVDLSERQRVTIRNRVGLILDGEVRRSEMGPSDLAVLRGRSRILGKDVPEHRFEPSNFHRIEPVVWYDSIEFIGTEELILFAGGANIDRKDLCNLFVPARLVWKTLLQGWYLSLSHETELITLIERLFHSAVARLTENYRVISECRLIDLFSSQVPLNLSTRLKESNRDPERGAPRLWIHLEGWAQKGVC